MACRIRWAPRAASQLEGICEYIAKDSPRYATLFARRVLQIIRTIPDNPLMGRVVPEYRDPSLRERIYEGYRIVYGVDNDAVKIVAICHGARELDRAMEDPSQ